MLFQTWKKYESPERWTSYFTQVDEVLRFQSETCLEIGVGNGIVTQALLSNGIHVATLDIDAALKPDRVGSVEQIPFGDVSFDVVLCAEVLEHLPYEVFETCLKEIARVAKKGTVISLPHWGYTLRLIVDVPLMPKIRCARKLPFTSVLPPGGEHCWELGRTDIHMKEVLATMLKYFVVEKEWLAPWTPYHHFFRLVKKGVCP